MHKQGEKKNIHNKNIKITNTFKYPRKKEIEAKKKVLDSDDSYQKKEEKIEIDFQKK